MVDIGSLIISGAKMLGTKLIKDNLGSFSLREILKKEQEIIREKGDDLILYKLNLISPYADFCELPDFEINNPTMNKVLTTPFYNAAKKIVFDLKYTDDEFKYCKENFLAKEVNDQLELIDFLTENQTNLKQNDSRYYLGFRSFYFAFRQNIDVIDYEYISAINKTLTPFFTNYKHKELFIPGLDFIEK
ncbi:hypothetical protein [Tenacibaculum sp. M341]|uniref:hypothetical protein n=1 Tax=Tenacibaculum sp. M341 TaxID=2530339 RepID=UPI00104CCCE7|nr:hypothetical protein [Tenacibaculum sp. M341]TCI93799.1 hypothetical protein EYW44_05120 [Tenacibaculum sp. M341]